MKPDGGSGLRCKAPHGCAAPKTTPAEQSSEPKPRLTRKGTPERTHCRICNCDDGKPCDLGAGRTCVWTDSGAAGASLCSLCAELIESAEELLGRTPEPTPQEVIEILAEDCEAPCVGDGSDARVAACVTAAISRRKAEQGEETPAPSNDLRSIAIDFLRANAGDWITAGTVAMNLAEGGIPPRSADVAIVLDAATAIGEVGRSASPGGEVRYRVPAPARPLATAPVSVLDEPCEVPERGGCGAAIGEPCAFCPREPASWAHAARFERWASREDREALRRWGLEDRIAAEVDRHAALPGNPPLPRIEGLVRGLVVPGEANAPEIRERVEAMLERGALVLVRAEKDAYLRRPAGAAPVAMGREGLAASPADVEPSPPAPERFVEPEAPESKMAEPREIAADESAIEAAEDLPGFPALFSAGLDDIARTCRVLREQWNRSDVGRAAKELVQLRAELEAEKLAHLATRGREASARADVEAERAEHAKTRDALAEAGLKMVEIGLQREEARAERNALLDQPGAVTRVLAFRSLVTDLIEVLGGEAPSAASEDAALVDALKTTIKSVLASTPAPSMATAPAPAPAAHPQAPAPPSTFDAPIDELF